MSNLLLKARNITDVPRLPSDTWYDTNQFERAKSCVETERSIGYRCF
jgi:hypothetical protein